MKQSLNFNWRFISNFKDSYLKEDLKEYEIINIPHTIKEVPYNYFDEKEYQQIVTYEKRFDVSYDISNQIHILRFDAFMVKADIYLNDIYLGKFVSLYIPVEIEVTQYLKQKDNRLLVVLDSHEDKNYPPFGLVVDYLTFSGIYREVNLYSHPKTYLKDIFVNGDMNGNINIKYQKVGDNDIDISHTLYPYPMNDNYLVKFKEDNFKLDNPKLWDIDHPNLYILKTHIKSIDGEESYFTRFGFRTSKFTKDGFYLNNKRIQIRGLNRHQGYPVVGYAMPKGGQIDDANILKYELGLNAVRTSHYPQSEHFIFRCDEIGLLVINEIPGWQHLSKDELWRNQAIKNTEIMVIEQRNHPSVILNGVRVDESVDDHDLYLKTNQIAHNLNPYVATIGVRNFKHSELLEDVYGYNDFVCNSLKRGVVNPNGVTKKDKPYLITEYMGHMNPVKPTSDEMQRIETSLHHLKVLNDAYKYKRIAGTIGWCFVDYHTHYDFGSGDRICAHGVLDLYRNPKYTSYVYMSEQDDKPFLEVLCNLYPGDQKEAIFNNIYVLTNCDYVELYKNNIYVETFYPKKVKPFENLKHPPILIDDIVGKTFDEPRFNKKCYKKMAKIFSKMAFLGAWHLPISDYIYMIGKVIRYHLKYEDIVHLFNKYVATWGGEAKTYTFKGYKDGVIVATSERGPATKYDLRVIPNKTILKEEDTYDVLRIRVQYIDEHGSILNYANRVVNIDTSGPIKVVGDKSISLLGGQISFYIFSKGEKGKGKIKISLDNIVKEIDVEVI